MVESIVGGSTEGDGDCVDDCLHRNRYLRAKAAIAGRAKFPARTAFAARAAIPMVVVWLLGEW